MAKPTRVPKDAERHLADCESHLRFLAEAADRLETEPDRYKQLAAELRVLVGSTKTNKPLLLDLLDEYQVEFPVAPIPDLPFPIQLVGQPPTELPADVIAGGPERIWEHYRATGVTYSLRDFVQRGLAVYVAPREYSYNDLVLAVAQQIGSGHEDATMEASLRDLETILIGGYSGYAAPLRSLSQLVLDAGGQLIGRVALDHGYTPRWYNINRSRPSAAG